MATEVLRPKDILLAQKTRSGHRDRSTSSKPLRKLLPSQTTTASRKPTRPSAGKRTKASEKSANTKAYAGPAFSVSPEPSSLPLPQFPFRSSSAVVDDAATRSLRRMLRLD